MKKLLFLLLFVFLVSCSCKSDVGYFETPRTIEVTISGGGFSSRGILTVSDTSLTFAPETPDGLIITVDDSGGSVSFSGIELEGVSELSRLKGVWDAIKANTVTLDGDVLTLGGFEIKIHKELSP